MLSTMRPTRTRILTIWHAVAWTLPLAIVATIVMWPSDPLEPGAGLDPSWTAGLTLARRAGLHFGDEIAFTYGPLGFALFPSNTSRSGLVISLIVLAIVCGSFAGLTAWALRERTGDPRLALLGALVIVVIAPSTGTALADVTAIALLAAVLCLLREGRPLRPWWNPVLASFAALLLLTKVSTGAIALVGVAALWTAAERRRERIAWSVGAFTITFLVLWIALGQRLTDIGSWLLDIASVMSGYSWAMQTEEPGRRWELVVAVLVALGLGVAGVRAAVRWHRAAETPGGLRALARAPRLIGRAVTWAAGFIFVFKEGFVRHDIHAGIFLFAGTYALATVPNWRVLHGRRAAYGGAWLVSLLMLVSSGGGTLAGLLDPSASAAAFLRVTDQLVSRRDWRLAVDTGRQNLIAASQVPDSMVTAMRGHRVHVDPISTSVVWAYDLTWQPTPVFQRYQAYTERLDGLGADVLASTGGPEFVLHGNEPTIDGRFGLLESPQTTRALLCHFVPVDQDARWLLFARSSDADRCSARTTLTSVHVQAGEAVAVPQIDAATQALLVSIEFDTGAIDTLQASLYRADEYAMILDGTSSRVLPKVTVEAGPIYIPPSAGWGDAFRTLTEPPRTVAVDHAATVTFSVTDIRATAG